MAYLGLLRWSKSGKLVEVKGKGYRRVDLSAVPFGLDVGEWSLHFANAEQISFPPAKGDWGEVAAVGFYAELVGGSPVRVYRLHWRERIPEKATMCFLRGQLQAYLDREVTA